MRNARRVSRTRSTRNNRAPCHAKTATRRQVGVRERHQHRPSRSHQLRHRPRVLDDDPLRHHRPAASASEPSEPSEPTTPTPSSAATSAHGPASRSAPAAQASRATSPEPVRTPMTSSGYASRTAATNGGQAAQRCPPPRPPPHAPTPCAPGRVDAGLAAFGGVLVWPLGAADGTGATAMTSNSHGSNRRPPSRSTPAARTPMVRPARTPESPPPRSAPRRRRPGTTAPPPARTASATCGASLRASPRGWPACR